MVRRLFSFFRLSFSDQGLLIQAALAVINAKLATRTWPLPTARAIVTRQQRLISRVVPVRADRIAWAVDTASRAIPGMKNCLVQAVAAEAMLIQAGYPCKLRIGGAKKAGEFIAHAWVESEGRVVIGEFELERYTPMNAPSPRGGTPPAQP